MLGSSSLIHAKGSAVNGSIAVEGNKKLRNVIIYLQPDNPGSHHPKSRTHKVSQKGRAFNPSLLVIADGDLVQWLNDEDKEIDHNIYSLSKIQTFDLGLGNKGSVLEKGFDSSGRLNYFCSVHKTMEGKLVVLPTRYYTVLKKPGNFILPDIPPGKWKLKAVVFHRRYKA
ncbi:MAG: hypothetical protein V3U37_00770, partial [Nitrospinaceae bacterium]